MSEAAEGKGAKRASPRDCVRPTRDAARGPCYPEGVA